MSYVLGLKAKLFRGPAGAQANTLVENVKDLTATLDTGEADVTTRKTQGWRATAATLKEATVEFDILYDPEDDDFAAFKEAYFGNSALALFVSDGLGSGLDADFVITSFTQNQNLEEAMTVSVTAKPTNLTRAPQWVTGSGS